MDLNEIKQLLAEGGGKIVIVENDKPTFIVIPYEEYKGKKTAVVSPAIGEQKAETSQPSSPHELTLDDLPL